MKRTEIKTGSLLRKYLDEVFEECGRAELRGKTWQFATLFSGPNTDWPKELDKFMHGEGDSPHNSSQAMASYILKQFGNVAIRADERLAESTDPWITDFKGPGEVRTDEAVVGIVHPSIQDADQLSNILQDAVTLPFGLAFVLMPGTPSIASAEAHAVVVTGVFDGEAFILLTDK